MLHLEREIHEQPAVLARFLARQSDNVARIAAAVADADISHIVIAARGTSDNAATYGRYILESMAGTVVSLAAPSLFTLYHRPPRLNRALVIGVSQSGRGLDIVEVLRQSKAQGAMTLAITNFVDSPMAQVADHVIGLEAGEERAVAATKTYTAQLLALASLAAALAKDEARLRELVQVPEWVASALTLQDEIIRAAERYRYMEVCAMLGRGYNYATAFEIALKLKETCYLSTQPYSTADFRHGPIAMISPSFPVFLVGPSGVVYDDVYGCAQELVQRDAELIAISDREPLLALARTPLRMPVAMPEWLSPIAYVVPGQLFALAQAVSRGYNPDQPRGLEKVTLTL
ncbi:MAG: SIS domain-containing protein [Chloroflexi bacterium]|nr:SIS domain-containing protein [Chloroflexota bacterium]